jgi:uncharacterized damage-inducible protein DinB
MNYLQTLMRYKQWANRLLYESMKEISEDELEAPRPIVSGSIIRTVNHTYSMDLVWQAHLQNNPHDFTTRNPVHFPTLRCLTVEQSKLDEWYVSYADTLLEPAENEVINFKFIGGGMGSMSRRDILLHVVNHGTYHRGNVAGMMCDCSVMPPTTDYPVFLKQTALNKELQRTAEIGR